jgi:hypothetical protein
LDSENSKGGIEMRKELKSDSWIWVVVQEPGVNEQFLGQFDEGNNEAFLPAFYHKEDAQQCLTKLQTKKGGKYEVQAIRYGELAKDAARNDFMIFMLGANGEILEKLSPIQTYQ